MAERSSRAAGERGIAMLRDRVAEFRDGVFRAIDYAKALDCSQLNCLVGIAPQGSDPRELEEVLIGNLRFAAAALAAENIKLRSSRSTPSTFPASSSTGRSRRCG